MKIEVDEIKMKGRYKIDVINSETKDLEETTGWFDNLITDNGLNMIGNNIPNNYVVEDIFITCHLNEIGVGFGTTRPALTDVGLENKFEVKRGVPYGHYTDQVTGHYVFWSKTNFTGISGVLTEVAVGEMYYPDRDGAFSRSLIPNGGLTLTSAQEIVVTYELRIPFPSTNPVTQVVSMDVDGVMQDVTVTKLPIRFDPTVSLSERTNNSDSYVDVRSYGAYPSSVASVEHEDNCVFRDGPNGTYSGEGTGAWTSASYRVAEPYITNSFQRVVTYRAGTTSANFAGGIVGADIRAAFLNAWQFEFSPPIPKDNTNIFDITVVTSWGRA